MPRVVIAMVMLALSCAQQDGGTTTQGDPTGAATGDTSASDSGSTGRDASDSSVGSEAEVGGSSEAPLPGACVDASDCRIFSDCCTCDAFASDEQPEECAADCDRTLCEEWGITEAICSHTCHLRLVDCDPGLVMCPDAPPECDDGFAPSIEMRCWTRHCVPVELCTPY
ncbi:MAG TPA: hypothetical protein VG755_05935 [Nannocystaceae bacterium]|nr:hypothetical protein [Nannocystaceae bacterium]